MELSDDFWNFIDEHIGQNVNTLRLKYSNKNNDWISNAIIQIDCRQRAKSKLSSWIKHKYFLFPSTLSFEQSSSEILAQFHASLLPNGAFILDMTCGLGIDAMTLAQKASALVACEINPTTSECVKHNVSVCGIKNMIIENTNSIDYLKQTDNIFDVIFVDPARRDNHNKRTFAFEDCLPDIISNFDLIAQHTSILFIKASPMLDITQIIRSFKHISDIWILSIKNECKEIVIKIDLKTNCSQHLVHAINFNADSTSMNTEISLQREVHNINYLAVLPDNKNNLWLYEPNSSLMKTFAWDFLCHQYPKIEKLHGNTHLFISEEYYSDFPGRILKVKEMVSLKELKQLSDLKANIIIRNAPFSISEFKKKYKVKEGGENFLYICRYGENDNIIAIHC